MDIYFSSQKYGMVSHDITNHCNARCKFCFNDWNKIHPHIMNQEVFMKARSIIPFCNQELFLFSCLFEPTLHPDFMKLLYMIPYKFRDKVFFTTNLVKKMSDTELLELCNAPVKYFNISLETYDREKYAILSGTKQSAFFDNLSRLGMIAKDLGKNNKIRIITMILQSNKDEIISLIKRVHKDLSPVMHELRTPYISSPIENVLEREMLSREELVELYKKINALGYKEVVLDLGRDKEIFEQHIKDKTEYAYVGNTETENPAYRVRIEPNGLEKIDVNSRRKDIKSFTYRVRINSDGTGYFNDTDECFNLNNIEDATLFWSEKLRELQKKEAIQYIIKGESSYDVVLHDESILPCELTKMIIYDEEFFTFYGSYQYSAGMWNKRECVLLLVQDGNEGVLLHTKQVQKNADEILWVSKVDKSALDNRFGFDVYIGYSENSYLHMRKATEVQSLKQYLR